MRRLHRHQTLLGGFLILVAGVVLVFFGRIRSDHPFSVTSGTITESSVLRGSKSSGQRAVTYRFSASGTTYTGFATAHYSAGHDEQYFVGHPLSVYFVSTHPATSYGFESPHALPWVVIGGLLSALGVLIIGLGWPH